MADDTVAVQAEILEEVQKFAALSGLSHEITEPHQAWMRNKLDALIAAVRAEHKPLFCRRCNGNLAHEPQCLCDHPLPS